MNSEEQEQRTLPYYAGEGKRGLTVILSAHLGLQAPSKVSHSEGGGSLLGKQLHRGSLMRSHPKIVGSSLYLRPA